MRSSLILAAYCRVSTETDEQATSYDAQIEHYTDYIEKHPGWELAGIYADDGLGVVHILELLFVEGPAVIIAYFGAAALPDGTRSPAGNPSGYVSPLQHCGYRRSHFEAVF